jgi:hypothetical protein
VSPSPTPSPTPSLTPGPSPRLTPGPAHLLLNFLTFQVGWFACVLGAAHGMPLLGVLTTAVVAAVWFLAAPRPQAYVLLLALTGVVGYAWDSALAMLGLVRYLPGPVTPPLAPLWMLALWVLFATTLQLSMRWLQQRLLWAAVLGAIAAPLSYLAGARLGAFSLARAQPMLLAQAIAWALLLPSLLLLARRLDV